MAHQSTIRAAAPASQEIHHGLAGKNQPNHTAQRKQDNGGTWELISYRPIAPSAAVVRDCYPLLAPQPAQLIFQLPVARLGLDAGFSFVVSTGLGGLGPSLGLKAAPTLVIQR